MKSDVFDVARGLLAFIIAALSVLYFYVIYIVFAHLTQATTIGVVVAFGILLIAMLIGAFWIVLFIFIGLTQ